MKYFAILFLSIIMCLSLSTSSFALPMGTSSSSVVEEAPIEGKTTTEKQTRKQKKASRKALKQEKKMDRLQNMLTKFKIKKENGQNYWGTPLLIIGIVLLLAGAVVGIVFGLLGYLISLIGLGCIIVALLQIFGVIA